MSAVVRKYPALSQLVLALIFGAIILLAIQAAGLPEEAVQFVVFSASLAGIVFAAIEGRKGGVRELLGRILSGGLTSAGGPSHCYSRSSHPWSPCIFLTWSAGQPLIGAGSNLYSAWFHLSSFSSFLPDWAKNLDGEASPCLDFKNVTTRWFRASSLG
jgi:hypothetical protein